MAKGFAAFIGKESRMKIQSSSIMMASSHQETSYTHKESATIEVAKSKDAAAAILSISKESSGNSLKESMLIYEKQEKDAEKERQKEGVARSVQNMLERMKANETKEQFQPTIDEDSIIKMIKRILAAFRGEKVPEDDESKDKSNSNITDLRSAEFRKMESSSFAMASKTIFAVAGVSAKSSENGAQPMALGNRPTVGTTPSGTVWQKITATSGYHVEAESTTFASTGMVKTADGRSIDFNIEVSMSRAFMESVDMLEVKEYIKTDPLMINLDTNVGYVSDQKFFFDLDADGKNEEISFAGKGSGFLALDKNGDGKINDGSELFGTKSGDGFKDLATYDEDGNGWIDENDSIFSKLKVWTKDENGQDRLVDLKKADVGAIYLKNADTQYSLKDNQHNLNAEIKKTGIYLKESTGEVGTINHVDLAV